MLAEKINLSDLIDISGGLTNYSSETVIITEPKKSDVGNIILVEKELSLVDKEHLKYNINPGTGIRIKRLDSELNYGTVSLDGEVSQPGLYRILKNDTLETLILRSGGLTENAYLEGLLFTRLEEKKREQASINRLKMNYKNLF